MGVHRDTNLKIYEKLGAQVLEIAQLVQTYRTNIHQVLQNGLFQEPTQTKQQSGHLKLTVKQY